MGSQMLLLLLGIMEIISTSQMVAADILAGQITTKARVMAVILTI